MNTQQQPEPNNPLGIDRIEFIESSTTRPQALPSLLEQMGFVAAARHLRVFPGAHSKELSAMLRRLNRGGHVGDYSVEVFNDGDQAMA